MQCNESLEQFYTGFSLLKVMVVGYLIVKPTGPGNFAKTLLRLGDILWKQA